MTREEYLKELDSNLITLPREERDIRLESSSFKYSSLVILYPPYLSARK